MRLSESKRLNERFVHAKPQFFQFLVKGSKRLKPINLASINLAFMGLTDPFHSEPQGSPPPPWLSGRRIHVPSLPPRPLCAGVQIGMGSWVLAAWSASTVRLMSPLAQVRVLNLKEFMEHELNRNRDQLAGFASCNFSLHLNQGKYTLHTFDRWYEEQKEHLGQNVLVHAFFCFCSSDSL